MRIQYITNVRLPTAKAQGYAIMKMCSEFTRAGIQTELFVPRRTNFEIQEDPFEHYGIEKNFKIRKIFNFDLLGRTLKFGQIFYWIDIVVFIFVLQWTVTFRSDDVIYTRDFVLASFFSKKQHVCLEIHAIPKSRFLFQRALKKASVFVVLNNYLKQALIERGVPSTRIVVAPSAVDMTEFPGGEQSCEVPGLNTGDFVYGYVGTLKTMGMEKGVELGLQALALLPTKCKFLIVGGEPDEVTYYKRIAEQLGVVDRAIFVGKVPHLSRSTYISVCNVLIAPFPENEHYSYFMSPLKIFEYMASKKPIVATDLPTLREVLTNGENAILIPPNSAQYLAQAVIRLQEDPEYSTKLLEKAYTDVLQKYTWEKRVTHILEKIRSLVSVTEMI